MLIGAVWDFHKVHNGFSMVTKGCYENKRPLESHTPYYSIHCLLQTFTNVLIIKPLPVCGRCSHQLAKVARRYINKLSEWTFFERAPQFKIVSPTYDLKSGTLHSELKSAENFNSFRHKIKGKFCKELQTKKNSSYLFN